MRPAWLADGRSGEGPLSRASSCSDMRPDSDPGPAAPDETRVAALHFAVPRHHAPRRCFVHPGRAESFRGRFPAEIRRDPDRAGARPPESPRARFRDRQRGADRKGEPPATAWVGYCLVIRVVWLPAREFRCSRAEDLDDVERHWPRAQRRREGVGGGAGRRGEGAPCGGPRRSSTRLEKSRSVKRVRRKTEGPEYYSDRCPRVLFAVEGVRLSRHLIGR